ncbi:hypothetical protein C8A01DRAFT_37300 [Parachaetomium inaequale]|uniref:Uncharacterized protein n=1 Tax=Parachaetomium inaequale TaxID=2588326 RepID=A0AAN6SQP2_9PEZI|nr:hypothetical protein C8A01DRAFT_37300 [Parachaetomium inaequale]
MDLASNASPRSVPTPQSPAPLALSEFMAQTTPCSDTTTPSDKPALPQHVSRPAGGVEEPKQAPVRDEPRAETPQQPPKKTQPQETQPPPPTKDDTPPPTDWLATRQQLLPRRNQGKKADWIRGWSQAVSSHGEQTYCACSEPIESSGISRGRKAKTSAQLADNVRAILQRTSSPSSNNPKTKSTTPVTPEPEVCRHCNRPPSPPPDPKAGRGGGSSSKSRTSGGGGGKLNSPGGGGGGSSSLLGKRFSELFMRVRRPSSLSRSKRDAAESRNNMASWPEDCQPRWATTAQGEKRFLATAAAASAAARPPSQPVSAPAQGSASASASASAMPKSKVVQSPPPGGGKYFSAAAAARRLLPAAAAAAANNNNNINGAGGGVRAAGLAPSSSSSAGLDGISDSDADAPRPGLSRSMSRLQRAAALLQRATTRSKD